MPPVVSTSPPEPPVLKKHLHPVQYILPILLAGAVFAGIVAVVFLNSSSPLPPETYSSNNLARKSAAALKEITLNLDSPQDTSLVENKLLTVSGSTLPDTTVVFYTGTRDGSAQSDANGNFSGEIELDNGVNSLIITALAADGREKTVTADVVFDSQVLGVSTGKSKFSQSADRVAVGQLDSATAGGIQIKQAPGQTLKYFKIDKSTKYVDENNKPLKVNINQLKSGVLVLTSAEDTATRAGDLKKAVKIFVRSATDSAQLLLQSKRRAVQGVVSAIDGKTITLTHQTQRDRTFTVITDSTTVFKVMGITDATISQIQPGERIVAIGSTDSDGVIIAKRIHIIPGKATGIFEHQLLATPSATITVTPPATPSAVPSVTPSATPSATPVP